MTVTQPRERIAMSRQQVDLYERRIETWKVEHEQLKDGCWALEDLAERMNFEFERTKDLDLRVQESSFLKGMAFPPEVYKDVRGLFHRWLEVAIELEAVCPVLLKESADVDGLNALRANIEECKAIVTPDDEFFGDPRLDHLASEAIEQHRLGATEPTSDGLTCSK